MFFEFAEKTIAGVIFAIICLSLAYFFGQENLFDPIIIVTFIAVSLFFRRNKDLVFVCLIFIVERGMEELVWRILQNEIWFKLPAYLIFIYCSYYFARGTLKWFGVLFFTFSFGVEIYWYFSTDRIPFTLLSCYMVAAAIMVRYALRRRVFWQINLTGKRGQPLDLDLMLLRANACFIALHTALTLEFYVRELLDIRMTIVYYANTPIAQGLSLFIIYMIIIESLRHLKSIELRA